MLEALDLACGNISSLDVLLRRLQEVLGQQRFLLILDDVWNEDHTKWEHLKNILLIISKNVGNMVLVTSRREKVALIMESLCVFCLNSSTDDVCWSIIRSRVLKKSQIPEELEDIGFQIAVGCRGAPLVVNVVKQILCDKIDRDSWLSIKQILDSWNCYSENPCGILSRLLEISFDCLPGLALKQCFAYCSIFPKGSIMKKEMLIQLWMAQGFLQPSEESSEEMEDIGDKYFNNLLSHSIFQDVEKDIHGQIVACKMHDIIHGVAQFVSKFETLILKDGSESNISNTRHLSLIFYASMEPPKLGCVTQSLYSLFSKVDVCPNIAVNFKRLLVLSFCGGDIDELPTSLGKLKRLRYLDVSETKIKNLPKFISKLYNLQTFKFRWCNNLRKPPEIGDLINLRHIYFSVKEHMPTSIGRLTCLRTLPLFVVGQQKGHGIEELGCLSQLRGKLEICNLENVRDKSTAKRAKLVEKSAVCELEFGWEDGSEERSKHDEDVFEGLEPPSNVKSLTINGYGGENCPSWMVGKFHLRHNLVMLSLLHCHNLRSVPSLSLSNLRELRISFCGKLESIQSVSLSCEAELVIVGCKNLKSIAVSSLQELKIDHCDELASIEFNAPAMESLKKVDIERCAKLRSLPVVSELATLQMLRIWECKELSSIGESLSTSTDLKELIIWKCPSLMFFPNIHRLSSLHTLSIEECDGLTSLPSGLLSCIALEELMIHCNNLNSIPEDLNALCSLVHLDISRCRNLMSIPGESLGSLACLKALCIGGFSEALEEFPGLSSIYHLKPSLENLTLIGWENLRHLPHQIQHLTHLRKLRIEDFHGVEVLPEWLGDLTSLKILKIIDCKSLKHMPSMEAMHRLSELHFLHIYNCPELKVRCDRESGSEWPKISHIITIRIT